jgi:hypothetical protein
MLKKHDRDGSPAAIDHPNKALRCLLNPQRRTASKSLALAFFSSRSTFTGPAWSWRFIPSMAPPLAGNHRGFLARVVQGHPRRDELDFFESVGRENCHAHTI